LGFLGVAFDEYRHDRKRRADMKAVHARGEKLPSEDCA
jgi:hypothetical protein